MIKTKFILMTDDKSCCTSLHWKALFIFSGGHLSLQGLQENAVIEPLIKTTLHLQLEFNEGETMDSVAKRGEKGTAVAFSRQIKQIDVDF